MYPRTELKFSGWATFQLKSADKGQRENSLKNEEQGASLRDARDIKLECLREKRKRLKEQTEGDVRKVTSV